MNYSLKYSVYDLEVLISSEVAKIAKKFCQDKLNMTEAGGILLGYFTGSKVYITKASVPNSYDKRSRYEFIRDKAAAQAIIDYEFLNSNGCLIYLGEWHTHPENIPSPSAQDETMIKGHYIRSTLNENFIFLLIQGIKGVYLGCYLNGELRQAKAIL